MHYANLCRQLDVSLSISKLIRLAMRVAAMSEFVLLSTRRIKIAKMENQHCDKKWGLRSLNALDFKSGE